MANDFYVNARTDGQTMREADLEAIEDGFDVVQTHVDANAVHIKARTAATDGATVTFDLSANSHYIVTLGGNRTLAISNGTAGQWFTIQLKQDATGSRTVTWWANITWSDGGSEPTLTTTASKTDTFRFYSITATTFEGFVGGQNL